MTTKKLKTAIIGAIIKEIDVAKFTKIPKSPDFSNSLVIKKVPVINIKTHMAYLFLILTSWYLGGRQDDDLVLRRH